MSAYLHDTKRLQASQSITLDALQLVVTDDSVHIKGGHKLWGSVCTNLTDYKVQTECILCTVLGYKHVDMISKFNYRIQEVKHTIKTSKFTLWSARLYYCTVLKAVANTDFINIYIDYMVS
jgi:hypothetical protein